MLTYTATHQTLITDSGLFPKIQKKKITGFRDRCRTVLKDRGRDKVRTEARVGETWREKRYAQFKV